LTDDGHPDITLHFEMGCTLADFHRLLPAVATIRYNAALNRFIHEEDDRCWSVQLGTPRERPIAALRLPVVDVVMEFRGYARQDVDAVVERFLAHFRRGGG
jgi:hypothetical protein